MPYGIQQIFPDQLTDTNTSAVNELGTLRYEGGNRYMYVQNGNTATAISDQCAVAYMNAADFTVTPKTVLGGQIAGIAIADIAASSYGWIQVGGFADCTNHAGDVDDMVQAYCMTTAGVIAAVDGTNQATAAVIGYGVADATSNIAKVYINL